MQKRREDVCLKKRLAALVTVLVLAICLALPTAAVWQPPEQAVNAEAVYLYQLDTDTLVFEKNAEQRRTPASLTKLMTALLLVESGEDLSAEFTIPEQLTQEFQHIRNENGSNADLKIGETVRLESLLYACLLPSGNDAASAIAYYLSNGDMPAFYERMNERAAELGCSDTHFSCATGLDSMEQGTYSTARDMFLIARACWQNETLMKVMCSTEYWMPKTNIHTGMAKDAPEGTSYRVRSTVSVQDPSSPLYREYIRGMKTGFTNEAGRCFVSAAKQDGSNWLLVVMGAPDGFAADGMTYAFHTAVDLYDWALERFTPAAMANTERPVLELPLKWCSKTKTIGAYPADPTVILTDRENPDDLIKTVKASVAEVETPVKTGQVLGTLTVEVNGEAAAVTDLVAVRDYSRSGFLHMLDRLRPYRWAAVILGGAILGLIGFWINREVKKARVRKRRRKIRVAPPRKMKQ